MATESSEKTIKSMQKEIKSLKHEVERLSAAREIENLLNTYAYRLSANRFDALPELFALKTPGLVVELGELGVYEGAEGVKKLYLEVHPKCLTPPSPGGLIGDYNASPVIEVAEDGQTAKGLWYSPGFNTGYGPSGKLEAVWFFQKRAMDFVKEDGKWKIWHYRAYVILVCPFYTSWADMPEAFLDPLSAPLPDDAKPDKPTTPDLQRDKIYSPKYVIEYVPKAPEPYATWEETFSY